MTSSLCRTVSPQKFNGLSINSPNITCNVRFRLRKNPKYIFVVYWEQRWGCEGTKRGECYYIYIWVLFWQDCIPCPISNSSCCTGYIMGRHNAKNQRVILWQHTGQYCVSILIMWISETMYMYDELGVDEGSWKVRSESVYKL